MMGRGLCMAKAALGSPPAPRPLCPPWTPPHPTRTRCLAEEMFPEKEKILDKLELSLIHSGEDCGFRPGLGLLCVLSPMFLGLLGVPSGPCRASWAPFPRPGVSA